MQTVAGTPFTFSGTNNLDRPSQRPSFLISVQENVSIFRHGGWFFTFSVAIAPCSPTASCMAEIFSSFDSFYRLKLFNYEFNFSGLIILVGVFAAYTAYNSKIKSLFSIWIQCLLKRILVSMVFCEGWVVLPHSSRASSRHTEKGESHNWVLPKNLLAFFQQGRHDMLQIKILKLTDIAKPCMGVAKHC